MKFFKRNVITNCECCGKKISKRKAFDFGDVYFCGYSCFEDWVIKTPTKIVLEKEELDRELNQYRK